MIEPNQPHGYEIQAQVSIINCLFYPEQLSYENNQMLQSTRMGEKSEDIKRQWEELLQYVSLEDTGTESNVRQANLNAQGIIHLNSTELSYVESLLREMVRNRRIRKSTWNMQNQPICS